MYYIIILIILLVFYYVEFVKVQHFTVVQEEKKRVAPKPDLDWNEAILNKNVEESVKQSHREYAANVREFNSGSNFTSVADDNTTGIFTNFLGFSRPRYVEIGEGARQIPDVDTEVLKRNKRLTFKNDYF